MAWMEKAVKAWRLVQVQAPFLNTISFARTDARCTGLLGWISKSLFYHSCVWGARASGLFMKR